MQKVVGSSPIIRSRKAPLRRGVFDFEPALRTPSRPLIADAVLPLACRTPVVPLVVHDREQRLHRVAGDVEDLAGVDLLRARVELERKQDDRRAAIGALDICRLVGGHLLRL